MLETDSYLELFTLNQDYFTLTLLTNIRNTAAPDRGNSILHQKNRNENYKNTVFSIKNQKMQ